jgi:4-hydroxy-tetrahydrodipicolinate synthase
MGPSVDLVDRPAAGVHAVLCTPFRPDGAVDVDGVERMVDYYEAAGVQGLVVASVFGEGALLDPDERELLMVRVVARRRRAAVMAAVLADDTEEAVRQAERAVGLGATQLLVKPPLVEPGRLLAHFARVAAAAPVILLDHPTTRTRLSIPTIAALLAAVPGVVAIKLEEEPTPPKIRTLRACVGRRIAIFGGLGGAHCMAELGAGAEGFFTGYPLPGHLVEIVERHRCGDVAGALAVFRQTAPLLESQPRGPAAIAFRKEVLRRLGVIAHAGVRHPTTPLSRALAERIGALLPSALPPGDTFPLSQGDRSP